MDGVREHTSSHVTMSTGSLVPAVGGRSQLMPVKLKKVAKLKDHIVVSSACGAHATAMVTKDGKLHMFGSLEAGLVDRSTGECCQWYRWVMTFRCTVELSKVDSIGKSVFIPRCLSHAHVQQCVHV